MSFERTHYLPILITLLFPITFIITYTVAVCNNDVSPLFPYISDTGAFSPESCIFGQMLNLGAMIIAAASYIRYLQLHDLIINNNLHDNVEKYNWPTCIMGLLTALGISIVGNFQEVNAIFAHIIGALLAFGVGGVYISFQTYIAFKVYPVMGNKTINYIRIALSAGAGIFFILVFVFATISGMNGGKQTSLDIIYTHWDPDEPAWVWHFLSTVSEWMLALCFVLYLSTFTYEFKRISLSLPRVSNKLK